jgi:hypothetical protein
MTSEVDPEKTPDFWMVCLSGPVAEHNLWVKWDYPTYGAHEVHSGSEGDISNIVDTLVRGRGKRKKRPNAAEKADLIKGLASSLARILQDDLNTVGGELCGDKLSESFMTAVNSARAILKEHAAAHIALVDALVNAVPDAAGDRILNGAQVQEIWDEKEASCVSMNWNCDFATKNCKPGLEILELSSSS